MKMKIIPAFLLTISLFPFITFAQNTHDHLIFPDPDNPIEIVTALPSDGKIIKGIVAHADTGFLAQVKKELMLPYHHQMIRVSQCARNFTGNSNGPNLLFLSQNEGGFPRQGIELESKEGVKSYPDLHFVDLVIDQGWLDQGALSIYSHELGHVMMNLILNTFWDRFPNPTSPKQHVSMGVTDYLTAFYEGWGISFQRLAYDAVEKYRDTFHDKMNIRRGLTMAWHSNLDEYLRLFNVENNGYIYQKSPIDPVIWDTLNPEQRILFEHTSTQFDINRIKNAQEMLSCEGFISTLFYQLLSNQDLQNNFAAREFYSQFLLKPLPDGIEPSDVFSPLENVLLKNLAIWDAMDQTNEIEAVTMQYLKTWIQMFPDDSGEIISSYILLSRGTSVENELPRLVEKVNLNGQIGDIALFRKYSSEYSKKVQEVIAEMHLGPEFLSAELGPELWISHPTITIRRALWMPEPKAPLQININSAGFAEIAAFIGEEKAREFINFRRERGFFKSFEEAGNIGFIFE